MANVSQWLIIAGTALVALDLLLFVPAALLRRNGMQRWSGTRAALGVLLAVSMALLCGYYGCVYTIHFKSQTVGVIVFCASALFTSMLGFFLAERRDTQRCNMELLEALVGVIEAGDPNLDGHSLHVRNLAMLLYSNLPPRYRLRLNADDLQYAALLLDIGKLGVPRAIINKSGKLEPEEWEFMRRHPEIGAMILQPIPSFAKIARWIQYHHERVDGSGYYHLRGSEIPLASRIIAIADTYSAITMDRNYKPSRTNEDAIAELRLVAGSQLDAELVACFCRIPVREIEASMNSVRQKMQRYQSENFR